MSGEVVRITLRLDKELYDALRELSEIDQRSLNGEIIYILGKYDGSEDK